MRIRRLLPSCLLVLALAAPAFATGVLFTWDPKPAGDTRTSIRVYERTGAAAPYTYTLVGSVADPATSLTLATVTPGSHAYIARGYNGQSESVDSNAVSAVILAVPGAVTSVTLTFVP